MSSLTRLLQKLVRDHSGAVIVVFVLLTLAAALPASRVRIDTALEHLMLRDDPERLRTQQMKATFGNDQIVVVAFDLGRPFEADDLRRLNDLAGAVAEIDGVEEVLDLSTIEDVRGDGEMLDGSPLVELAALDGNVDGIRARALGHRLYESNLLSDAGDVLALVLVLDHRPGDSRLNYAVSDALIAVLEQADLPWPTWISGYPYSEYDAFRLLSRDLTVLTTVAFVVLIALVYAVTRSGLLLGLVLALAAWTEAVGIAWFGATGTPLTIVTSIVPSVLLATTATYAVYLLGMLERVSREPEPGPALVAVLLRPTLLAALSTGAGFLSLRLMPVAVLGSLGTGLALGVAAAAAGALLLLPAAVHRLGLRLDGSPLARLDAARLARPGFALARRPRATLAASGLLAALVFAGVARLEVDSDPLEYWAEDSYHRQSARFVRDRLSGTMPINVLVRGEGQYGALDPHVLGFAHDLVERIEAEPAVDRTISFLDYLWLMDAALIPGETPRTVLPSRELAAQYMLLYEAGGDPDDYRHYIDYERSTLNVLVRLNDRSSTVALGLRDRVRGWALQAPPGVEVEVLGTWLLFPKAMDGITRGMVQGLALALAIIGIVMIVALCSVSLGLVSLIPCAIPVLACMGLMGWIGVPLSMGTAVVGCVAVGLAVDDTAHVLGHLRRGRPLLDVYRMVSPALVLTTAFLGLGFGVLALSSFQPVAHLGLATALTLVAALACNLLLLPSLLVLLGWPAEDPAAGSLPLPCQSLRTPPVDHTQVYYSQPHASA